MEEWGRVRSRLTTFKLQVETLLESNWLQKRKIPLDKLSREARLGTFAIISLGVGYLSDRPYKALVVAMGLEVAWKAYLCCKMTHLVNKKSAESQFCHLELLKENAMNLKDVVLSCLDNPSFHQTAYLAPHTPANCAQHTTSLRSLSTLSQHALQLVRDLQSLASLVSDVQLCRIPHESFVLPSLTRPLHFDREVQALCVLIDLEYEYLVRLRKFLEELRLSLDQLVQAMDHFNMNRMLELYKWVRVTAGARMLPN